MKFYEVGGAVRDSLMGVESKDVDFAVEAESFQAMEESLKLRGFHIFLSTPKYFTVRARVPVTLSPLFRTTKVADFVLCRKDGPTKDGRRPEYVEPGTILDDLARRDFTMNAIARDPGTGSLIDPYDGAGDIQKGILKFVGDPYQRIAEDGLRVLRGLRFRITKNLRLHHETDDAFRSDLATDMIKKVSVERVREELEKMFSQNTFESLLLFNHYPRLWMAIASFEKLRLMPTLKQV